MEELRDENVNFQHSVYVLFFDLTQYINKPFKVLVCTADP
jgi:hypothetical protein